MKHLFHSCIAMAMLLNFCACKRAALLQPSALVAENLSLAGLQCTAQTEQTDYSIYKMCSDGARVGDVNVYYDSSAGQFYVYYLKNVWNDVTHQHHPWYAFTSTNLYSYAETSELIQCRPNTCDQDFGIGAGSVVKSGSNYYAFYTGFNPNTASCSGVHREAVMRAVSTNPGTAFSKDTTFSTISVPTGLGYDENDNFRDPYVYKDGSTYYMLVAARKNVSGTWKGVIVYYTSTNLNSWTFQGVLYDGGTDNFFMMETPQLVKLYNTYYLVFSDQINKYVYYRKCSTITGTWAKPAGYDRFDGKGIFSAKIVPDKYGDMYLFGWDNNLDGDTDNGAWLWGGNLVAHKIYPLSNGDIAVTIPHTVKSYLETHVDTLVKNSQWGNVTNTVTGTESYRLISTADLDVANVIYNPISDARYKISATVNYNSASKDFGFMIGACDGYEDFYSLRFVPSQNRFSFDTAHRSTITTSTVARNDVPITLAPNTDYHVQIVIENSVVVVYINDVVALTCRIYKAPATNWGIFVDHSDVTFSNVTVTHG